MQMEIICAASEIEMSQPRSIDLSAELLQRITGCDQDGLRSIANTNRGHIVYGHLGGEYT